jgi:hypothetical protein
MTQPQQPPTQVFAQQRRSGCGTLPVALWVLAIITAIVILSGAFGLLGWIFSSRSQRGQGPGANPPPPIDSGVELCVRQGRGPARGAQSRPDQPAYGIGPAETRAARWSLPTLSPRPRSTSAELVNP